MAETLKNKEYYVPSLLDNKYEFNIEGPLKIATVGDMHLHHSTPASRIDNYSDTCIEKLRILRRELNARGIKYLFLEGDTFHIPKERSDFEYRVIEEFYKFDSDGINVYEIVGNHSISNDRIDSIDKTTLGIMYLTGALKPYTEVRFVRKDKRDVVVTGLNFPNDVQPVTDFEAYNILVCHKFYDNNLDSNSIMKKDLSKLGYSVCICGHDHQPYPIETVTTSEGLVHIVRPGSFMRGTSHKYNTNRLVYMDVLEFSDEINSRGKQVEIERVTLPVKDPKEIFSSVVMEKSNVQIKDITKELANLIDQLYSQDISTTSVYDVLDNSVIDAQIKNRIVQYLEQFGIYRK